MATLEEALSKLETFHNNLEDLEMAIKNAMSDVRNWDEDVTQLTEDDIRSYKMEVLDALEDIKYYLK